MKAHIQPNILRWARERAQLSSQQLAQKMSVKSDKVTQWESGYSLPSLEQAHKISLKLHIPFGYLFLEAPPKTTLPIPDLRTIHDATHAELSIDFFDILNDTLLKQDWYREFAQFEGYGALPFIASFTKADSYEIVARSIADELGISPQLRTTAKSWNNFFDLIIQNAEQKRILVMRNSVVGNNAHRPLSVEEFRGFALCDTLAPVIFINSRDAKSAQIFTLLHEIAHLWIGESGISNPNLRQGSGTERLAIERFCNLVAAEVLTPKKEFLSRWDTKKSRSNNLENLVRYFRVSSIVILRRALDTKLIGKDTFFQLWEQEIKKQKVPAPKSSGGDPFATNWTRNSKRFTRAVVTAAFEERLPYREAAQLLGIKVRTLHGLATRLEKSE
jgi:Zn-dependent peptidase ImmA (M78 family)/transcriptional regulator with XRE-family HTH domain